MGLMQYQVVEQNSYERFRDELNEWAAEGFRIVQFQLGEERIDLSEREVSPRYVAVMERDDGEGGAS